VRENAGEKARASERESESKRAGETKERERSREREGEGEEERERRRGREGEGERESGRDGDQMALAILWPCAESTAAHKKQGRDGAGETRNRDVMEQERQETGK
jgi:hypothetical protein